MHVNFYYGGGGGGAPFSPEEGGHGSPWRRPWGGGVVKCICMNIHTEERGIASCREVGSRKLCVCVCGGGGGAVFTLMTYCCVGLNGVYLNTVQFDCLKHYRTTHLGNGSTLDDVPQEKDLERHDLVPEEHVEENM